MNINGIVKCWTCVLGYTCWDWQPGTDLTAQELDQLGLGGQLPQYLNGILHLNWFSFPGSLSAAAHCLCYIHSSFSWRVLKGPTVIQRLFGKIFDLFPGSHDARWSLAKPIIYFFLPPSPVAVHHLPAVFFLKPSPALFSRGLIHISACSTGVASPVGGIIMLWPLVPPLWPADYPARSAIKSLSSWGTAKHMSRLANCVLPPFLL